VLPARVLGATAAWAEVRMEGAVAEFIELDESVLTDLHLVARVAHLAQAHGAARRAFEMAVEYAKERRQFGQPIGRFQHVQNHIIQLVNHLDAARWTTYEALWRRDAGKPGADVAAHLAKAVASDGYVQAVNYSHEVHAGIGVMNEYGLTLYTRLSRSLYHWLGSPRYHRRKLGDLLVDYDLGPDPLD